MEENPIEKRKKDILAYADNEELLKKNQERFLATMRILSTMGNERLISQASSHVSHVRNNYDWKYFFEWLSPLLDSKKKIKWDRPPVSATTFIDDKYYLGNGENTFKKIREIALCITEGGYKEGVIMAGIGAGKSYTSQLLAVYITHKLLCMNNPHKWYQLAADKNITIINMGTSAAQAKNVVFTGISNLIKDAPFFKENKPEILRTEVRFDDRRIVIISGNSRESTPLGLNVFCAILDEAAFYRDFEGKDVAKEIYETLERRISSRFSSDGLIVMISSPCYQEDYIMKKLEKANQLDDSGNPMQPEVFTMMSATWKTQDKYKTDEYQVEGATFIFDQVTNSVVNLDKTYIKDEEVNLITDVEDHFDYRYWQIPMEFFSAFRNNPEKAKRDYGAVPSLVLEGFFPLPQVIDELPNPEHQDPVIIKDGKKSYIFPEPDRVPHYIHIDLALNRNGRGDFAGFCMAHIDRWEMDEQTGEVYPIVYIDLIEQIAADPDLKEISFEKIRQRIYDLQDFGFYIHTVTTDGFQCLRGDTQILLMDGKRKKISEIVAGDIVKSVDHRGEIVANPVMKAFKTGTKQLYRVYLENGKYIDCTDNHPFMMRDGTYTPANELKVGDELKTVYLNVYWRVSCVEKLNIKEKVWDIQLRQHHNFALGCGVFVHNSVDMQQILNSKGINTEYLSVDRTLAPYSTLKTVINMGRLDMYKFKPVLDELKGLELVKGKKVDHKSDGGKDCIAGDTKIMMLNGENIQIRDLVGKEFGVYASDEYGHHHVAKAHNVHLVGNLSVMRITLDNGEILECTDDHEIMNDKFVFIEAKDLNINDKLKGLVVGTTRRIVDIEYNVRTTDVYDMTVDKYHNFAISSGIFVHNCADALCGAVFTAINKNTRAVGFA